MGDGDSTWTRGSGKTLGGKETPKLGREGGEGRVGLAGRGRSGGSSMVSRGQGRVQGLPGTLPGVSLAGSQQCQPPDEVVQPPVSGVQKWRASI